jgi:hypothetical protein
MRKLVLVGTLALLLMSGSALAADEGTRATSGDPFAACTLGGDMFGGVVFPSTEPEVWLAANPARPRNLIGEIQQDRWSNGGAKGLVAPYSFDGGRSWGEVALPFSECAAPYYHGKVLHYDRASDPWVDIGPDGTAYAISISFNGNDNANAVGAATSSDGGRSWKNLRAITAESANDPSFPFNDKESITADPVVAGTAYAVWDRLQSIACPPGVAPASGRFESERVVGNRVGIAAALDCFDGPTMLSVTRDYGRTWSTPLPIVAAVPNEQTIANQIVVDPRTHTLYDFYLYGHSNNAITIENVASHDGGLTWGARQVVSEALPAGVHDPDTGAAIRTGDIIPEPAIDQSTGKLYVVWQDARFNTVDPTEDQVVISSSAFGGLTGTWTAPVLVNDPKDRAAFTPAIKVLPTGAVAVSYYRFSRHDRRADTLPVDLVLRVGSAREEQVGGPFNMLAAPYAFGYFVGDYQGMTVSEHGPTLFSTLTNCLDNRCAAVAGFDADGNPIPSNARNPTDVYAFNNDRQER